MGLDQFVFMYSAEQAGATQTDITVESDYPALHAWRKHPNLHGWMEALYREKGGTDKKFNNASVKLDANDLDRLEAAIAAGELPRTSGFFFGESRPEQAIEDREFLARARHAIARGFVVFYDSWW